MCVKESYFLGVTNPKPELPKPQSPKSSRAQIAGPRLGHTVSPPYQVATTANIYSTDASQKAFNQKMFLNILYQQGGIHHNVANGWGKTEDGPISGCLL